MMKTGDTGILKITSISFIIIIKEAQKYSIYIYIYIAERIRRVAIVPRVRGSNPSTFL